MVGGSLGGFCGYRHGLAPCFVELCEFRIIHLHSCLVLRSRKRSFQFAIRRLFLVIFSFELASPRISPSPTTSVDVYTCAYSAERDILTKHARIFTCHIHKIFSAAAGGWWLSAHQGPEKGRKWKVEREGVLGPRVGWVCDFKTLRAKRHSHAV